MFDGHLLADTDMHSVEMRTREMEKMETSLAKTLDWGFSIRFHRHFWYLRWNCAGCGQTLCNSSPCTRTISKIFIDLHNIFDP